MMCQLVYEGKGVAPASLSLLCKKYNIIIHMFVICVFFVVNERAIGRVSLPGPQHKKLSLVE